MREAIEDADRLQPDAAANHRVGALQEWLENRTYPRLSMVSPLLVVYAASRMLRDAQGHPVVDPEKMACRGLKQIFQRAGAVAPGGKDGCFWEPDNGHLSLLCSKLLAAYEFWRWDTAFWLYDNRDAQLQSYSEGKFKELTHEQKAVGVFLSFVDSDKKWCQAIADCLEGRLPGPDALQNEKDIEPTQHSVVILGGAGLGKTALVKARYPDKIEVPAQQTTAANQPDNGMDALYSASAKAELAEELESLTRARYKRYHPGAKGADGKVEWFNISNILQVTPLQLPDFVDASVFDPCQRFLLRNEGGWVDKSGAKKQFAFLVLFVDELHLETPAGTYGKLLIPLQDGIRVGRAEKPVHFVFASSKFRSKEEFLAEAATRNDPAMRDFATRVGHWIELPALTTLPEQRAVLCHAYGKDDSGKIDAYLNLEHTSARTLERFLKQSADASTDARRFYPAWMRIDQFVRIG